MQDLQCMLVVWPNLAHQRDMFNVAIHGYPYRDTSGSNQRARDSKFNPS
jgi:hypothetical protein